MTTTTLPSLRTQAASALLILEAAHLASLPQPSTLNLYDDDHTVVGRMDSLVDLACWAVHLGATVTERPFTYSDGTVRTHHRLLAEWYGVRVSLVAVSEA